MRLDYLINTHHDKYEKHQSSSHQGHSEGRARHRRERLFDASDIRLLILYFLAQNTAHGYELIKSIERLAQGEYVPSPGIIYPNLTLLEEMGYIRATESQSAKKAWQLTNEGQDSLTQQEGEVGSLLERLGSLGIVGENRRIPEVQRAIHNFRVALNTKLGKNDLPQETRYKIIDILDQAAKDIERCESS